MVLNRILQLLFSHPQFGPRLIQSLADSWPIRKAAKFTAYLYLRGKSAIEEQVAPNLKDMSRIDASRFSQTLRREIQKQWEDAKRKELERQQRR